MTKLNRDLCGSPGAWKRRHRGTQMKLWQKSERWDVSCSGGGGGGCLTPSHPLTESLNSWLDWISGAWCKQLRVRTKGTVPSPVHPRRSGHGWPRTVGDWGLQVASALSERRSDQTDFRHVDRLQVHRVEDSERVETVTTRAGGRVQLQQQRGRPSFVERLTQVAQEVVSGPQAFGTAVGGCGRTSSRHAAACRHDTSNLKGI